MKKTGALVAGEMSGHVFFKERWFGFDDGMYAGARLLEILSAFDNPSEVLNKLPQSISTPELNIDLPEGSNGHKVIEELAANAKFEGATEIITIDGLRVEFPDGFGLMRASIPRRFWYCVLKRIHKKRLSVFKTNSKQSLKAILH